MKTAEMKADIIQDFRGYCDEKIRPLQASLMRRNASRQN